MNEDAFHVKLPKSEHGIERFGISCVALVVKNARYILKMLIFYKTFPTYTFGIVGIL